MNIIRIWDLPTRLFHWSLAALAVAAYVTANIGGNATLYHFMCGYAILALLLFRWVWGFAGPRYARFSSFFPGRGAMPGSAQEATLVNRYPGHNLLGGLSVLAMLLFFTIQAVLGLFSNDDIFNDGPLVRFISKDTSDMLTGWHLTNQYVLIALVALHVAAIAYYRLGKRVDLIGPMLGGNKRTPHTFPHARDDWRVRLGGLLVVTIAAAVIYRIVNLAPAAAF